jgi:hypothetical protein
MKQVYPLFTAVLLFTFGQNCYAQILKPLGEKNVIRCYTVEVMDAYRKAHSGAETNAQFEKWLGGKIQERKALREQGTNYTIPVIFHIISKGEAVGTSPNLSAADINQQLLQLNKDYANQSNSQYGVAGNTGIQFVLAKTNAAGNTLAEPGIDRIDINSKSWEDYTTSGWETSYIDQTVKPASIWNADRYYNVWVVPNITRGTTTILLGYATFPASSTLPGLTNGETSTTCGVVVATSTIGSSFSPQDCGTSFGLGKTLSHETGHFLGLRHIWGDTDCGNDYCNDTPVQFTQNRGVPSHPKANSCGTADEMFENYMDYTDDIALNTFTVNQVDRMQTVMLNSPRRGTLATSTVGGVAATGSNKISFTNCTGTLFVLETASNNSYPRYKDLFLTMNTEGQASGSAAVTFNITGTAVSGDDYQVLTPTTVSFAAGDNVKPLNIRIFDNAKVDGDRTIIVNYTITGTGVTAGTDAQSLTITIGDDDNIRVGEKTINLLDESFEHPAGTSGLPTGWGLLTTNAYPNLFVASTNGDAGGSGNCAHITNDRTLKSNIYTKGSSGATVLQSPIIDGSSVISLGTLSFKYKTRGLVNGDQAYLTYTNSDSPFGPFYFFGSTAGATGYGPYSSNTTTLTNAPSIATPTVLTNSKFNIDFYWQTGTSTAGQNPGLNVDDIVLTATPFHVETAVSTSYTYDIKSGTGVNNFKSKNNKAVATISNASTVLTGVTAKVTQAGTGTTTVTTPGGSYLRSQKVFQISTATANTTATYQAGLYFTEAEMAVWDTMKLKLKILKVKDGVDLGSTLTMADAELVTATATYDTAAGYIRYNGNFTGFSQFMLVPPSISFVVTLTNFTATALQRNIQLSWTTLLELNNRGFYIERSIDGTNFTQVGWVDGSGTTTQPTDYGFIDNFVQPKVLYYYRIRQVNMDNSEIFSVIRNAIVNESGGIIFTVSPNPASGYINVFVAGTTSEATVKIFNMAGQKVFQKENINTFNGPYRITLPTLLKGVYNVIAYLPEGNFVKRIIVE